MKKTDVSMFDDKELDEWFEKDKNWIENCDIYPSLFNLLEPVLEKVDEALKEFGLRIELYHDSKGDPHEFNFGFDIKKIEED